MRIRSPLLLTFVCASAAAHAEGARLTFDCTITALCEAGASCMDLQMPLTFTLSPVTLDALGGGTYDIAYGDVTAEATAIRAAGPYTWFRDDRELTLTPMPDGQEPLEATLFSEDPLGIDPSTTTFLTCEVTQ